MIFCARAACASTTHKDPHKRVSKMVEGDTGGYVKSYSIDLDTAKEEGAAVLRGFLEHVDIIRVENRWFARTMVGFYAFVIFLVICCAGRKIFRARAAKRPDLKKSE